MTGVASGQLFGCYNALNYTIASVDPYADYFTEEDGDLLLARIRLDVSSLLTNYWDDVMLIISNSDASASAVKIHYLTVLNHPKVDFIREC